MWTSKQVCQVVSKAHGVAVHMVMRQCKLLIKCVTCQAAGVGHSAATHVHMWGELLHVCCKLLYALWIAGVQRRNAQVAVLRGKLLQLLCVLWHPGRGNDLVVGPLQQLLHQPMPDAPVGVCRER